MSLAYTITPSSVNLLLNGRMRTINETHINFKAVKEALKNLNIVGWSQELEDRIAGLVDIPAFIAKVTEGKVRVGDGAVYYGDKPVGGVISKRLIDMLRDGFDIRPLARFLDRLMTNPIPTAADELYQWMEGSNLPLTDDGCFLAFKKVDNDYTSFHDHKTDNSIGTKLPLLDESNYDTDRYRTCSSGYHFCSFRYLHAYFGNQGRVVICKIAPEDVVSIPHDYNNAKGRAKTYEIIGEVPEDEAAQFFAGTPVVDSFGTYEGDCATGMEDWSEDGCEGLEDEWEDDLVEDEDDIDVDGLENDEGYGGISGEDADLMGIDIDYFSPDTNKLMKMLLDGTVIDTPETVRKMAMWAKKVHAGMCGPGHNNDRLVTMFAWDDDPKRHGFWWSVYKNEASKEDYDTAVWLVEQYINIIADMKGIDGWALIGNSEKFPTDDGRHLSKEEIKKVVEAHGVDTSSRLLNISVRKLTEWLLEWSAK